MQFSLGYDSLCISWKDPLCVRACVRVCERASERVHSCHYKQINESTIVLIIK